MNSQELLEAERVQFDESFKGAELKTTIRSFGDDIMKIGKPGICWDCGRKTRWMSTSFYAFLCSHACVRHKWNEYWEDETKAQAKEDRYNEIRKELGYE